MAMTHGLTVMSTTRGIPLILGESAHESLGASPNNQGDAFSAESPTLGYTKMEEASFSGDDLVIPEGSGWNSDPPVPQSPGWAEALDPRNESPKHGTVKSSIFNLVSTIIGGGVLSLPYAFKQTGLVLGAVILAIVACMSAYSAHLLVACGRRSKVRD